VCVCLLLQDLIISAGRYDDASSAELRRVHQRKQMLACPVAVAELAPTTVPARPEAAPACHRHCVKAAAGHEHDWRPLDHLPPKPQLILRITVPQLAAAAAASGPGDAVLCHGHLVIAASSDRGEARGSRRCI
jgi:hypothetical protein